MDGEHEDSGTDLPPISVDQLTSGMASVVSAIPMDMATSSMDAYAHNITQVSNSPDYNQAIMDTGCYSDNMHQESLTMSNSYSLQTQVTAQVSYSHTLPQPAHPCPYPPPLPPAYMFPAFDYTSRPLLPPLPPEGATHTGESTFLGFQPPDARSFPPPFPGPFPYGLPPFPPSDKPPLPPLPTYTPQSAAETDREHPDTVSSTCPSISTRQLILPPPPSLQTMPPFPLLPPPPPPGQFFPAGGYPPPPPAHSQSIVLPPHDLPPCEELVKRHLEDISTVALNTDSNPASPTPSAMLSPNTSKLLQSAIESDAESIMALSPGTEPVPRPMKVDQASEFRSTDIVVQEEQAFSQYEVEIQKMRRVSPNIYSALEQIGDESKVIQVYRYEQEKLGHVNLPCCQFEAKSSAVQTDDVDSEEVSEDEEEESESDDSEGKVEVSEEEEESENDEEVSDTGLDTSDQDTASEDKVMSGNIRLCSEVDFSEEIPRVESPFNRIRPSLLKSYRASKRYKDKKKMKKSKILDILSPLSPYDTQNTRNRKKARRKGSDVKPAGSEMESELASSSEEISEVDGLPKTPFSVLSEQPATPSYGTRESSAHISPAPAEDKVSIVSTIQGSEERDFSPVFSPSSSEVPTPQPATENMVSVTPVGNEMEYTGFSGAVSEGMENYPGSSHSSTLINEKVTSKMDSTYFPSSTSDSTLNDANFKFGEYQNEDRHACVEKKLNVFGMSQQELFTHKTDGFNRDLPLTESSNSEDDENSQQFYHRQTKEGQSIWDKSGDHECCEERLASSMGDNMGNYSERDYAEDREGLHLVQEIQLYEKHLQSVVNGGDGISQGQSEDVEGHLTEGIVELNDKDIIDIRPIPVSALDNQANASAPECWSNITERVATDLSGESLPVSITDAIAGNKSSQKLYGYYSCDSDDIPSESESSMYEHSDSGDTAMSDETFKKPSIDSYLKAVGRKSDNSQKDVGLRSFGLSSISSDNVITERTEEKDKTIVPISLPNFGSSFGRPSQLTCLYATNFLGNVQSSSESLRNGSFSCPNTLFSGSSDQIQAYTNMSTRKTSLNTGMLVFNSSANNTPVSTKENDLSLSRMSNEKMLATPNSDLLGVSSMVGKAFNSSEVSLTTPVPTQSANIVLTTSHFQSILSPSVLPSNKPFLNKPLDIVQTVNSADYGGKPSSKKPATSTVPSIESMIAVNNSTVDSLSLNMQEKISTVADDSAKQISSVFSNFSNQQNQISSVTKNYINEESHMSVDNKYSTLPNLISSMTNTSSKQQDHISVDNNFSSKQDQVSSLKINEISSVTKNSLDQMSSVNINSSLKNNQMSSVTNLLVQVSENNKALYVENQVMSDELRTPVSSVQTTVASSVSLSSTSSPAQQPMASVSQAAASSVTSNTAPLVASPKQQLVVPLPKVTTGLCAIVVQPLDSLGEQPKLSLVITAMKQGEPLLTKDMAASHRLTAPLMEVISGLANKKKQKDDQKNSGKATEQVKINKHKQILPKPTAEELSNLPEPKTTNDKDVIIRIKNTNVCLETPLMDGPPISQGFYCVECNKMYPAGCSLHEQQYTCIQDNSPTKARTSVPTELCLRAMYNQTSPDFMGVICRSLILAKTKFGPLHGVRMTKQELENPQNTAYVWEIFDEENPNLVLDCRDENHSNWLMFVKRARSSREQNLMVYQESFNIYFITIREIGPGEELLYWYGRDYAVMLGLCTKPEDFFRCQKCHRQFPDKNSLQTHIKAAHPKLDTYTNRCGECGKVFKIPSLLQKHIRATHEGIKTYKCEVCSKAFNDVNNFRRHKKLHTDSARQFECSECGKKFTQKHHLTDHMAIHTGERNYPCRFCDKRFSRSQDVRSHEKTVHIVNTEFKCAKCDQIFYSRKYYKSHMKTHEPRQFHCHMCEKQFTQKVHLKAHLVAKHRTGIDLWENAVNYKRKQGSRVT